MNISGMFSNNKGPWLAHLVGVLLVMMCAWCGHQFSIQPIKNEVAALTNEQNVLEELTPQLGRLRRERRVLAEKVDQLDPVTDTSQTQLPVQLDEAKFLEQLGQLTRQSGIRLNDFGQTDIQHGPNFSSLGINIQFMASYQQLCEFFGTIEGLDFVFDSKQLSVVSTGEEKFRVTWAFDLMFDPNQQASSYKKIARVQR